MTFEGDPLFKVEEMRELLIWQYVSGESDAKLHVFEVAIREVPVKEVVYFCANKL